MKESESMKDPIRIFEYVFLNNLEELSNESVNGEKILNLFLGLLAGEKKQALENYIVTYLPYSPMEYGLRYSSGRVSSVKKNQSVIIHLTDFFDRFKKTPLALVEINKLVQASPKARRDLLLGFFPPIFDDMGYHNYGGDSERRKRRKVLLAIMEITASHESWLRGGPKSPERAIALAEIILKRVREAKKQGVNYKNVLGAWQEDIVYLKYNYFDSVLHLKGLKWPS